MWHQLPWPRDSFASIHAPIREHPLRIGATTLLTGGPAINDGGKDWMGGGRGRNCTIKVFWGQASKRNKYETGRLTQQAELKYAVFLFCGRCSSNTDYCRSDVRIAQLFDLFACFGQLSPIA